MATREITTNLVDADILAYECSAVNETKVDWDGDGQATQYAGDTSKLEANLDRMVAKYARETKAQESIICLTDEKNFRLNILPSYKANRKGAVKPLQLAYAKEYLAKDYRTYKKPWLEADDVMGILATHPKLVLGKKIIVSTDKDMKTIAGAWVHNTDKHKKPRLITEREAIFFHMEQTVTGDTVDGYKGCPKAGKVAYDKALERALEEGSMWANNYQLSAILWKEVVSIYESKGWTEDDALVQARCARILQHTDYDFKTNEVILWKPPTL